MAILSDQAINGTKTGWFVAAGSYITNWWVDWGSVAGDIIATVLTIILTIILIVINAKALLKSAEKKG